MTAPAIAAAALIAPRSTPHAAAATTEPTATATEAGAATRTTVSAHGRRTNVAHSTTAQTAHSAALSTRAEFWEHAPSASAATAPTLHGMANHSNRPNHTVG